MGHQGLQYAPIPLKEKTLTTTPKSSTKPQTQAHTAYRVIYEEFERRNPPRSRNGQSRSLNGQVPRGHLISIANALPAGAAKKKRAKSARRKTMTAEMSLTLKEGRKEGDDSQPDFSSCLLHTMTQNLPERQNNRRTSQKASALVKPAPLPEAASPHLISEPTRTENVSETVFFGVPTLEKHLLGCKPKSGLEQAESGEPGSLTDHMAAAAKRDVDKQEVRRKQGHDVFKMPSSIIHSLPPLQSFTLRQQTRRHSRHALR